MLSMMPRQCCALLHAHFTIRGFGWNANSPESDQHDLAVPQVLRSVDLLHPRSPQSQSGRCLLEPAVGRVHICSNTAVGTSQRNKIDKLLAWLLLARGDQHSHSWTRARLPCQLRPTPVHRGQRGLTLRTCRFNSNDNVVQRTLLIA